MSQAEDVGRRLETPRAAGLAGLVFSALFVAYILYRHHRPEIYAYAHHYLAVKWGAINTGVLILSSLTAAWAVRLAVRVWSR